MKVMLKMAGVLLAGMSLVVLTRAEQVVMPNMREGVKVGDWTLSRIEGIVEIKQTVMEVGAGSLVIKTETIMGGNVISSTNNEAPLVEDFNAAAADSSAPPKVTKGKTTLKGQEVDCWIFEKTTPEGKVVRAYFSPEVPVNGMIRSELDGETTFELVDFGRK